VRGRARLVARIYTIGVILGLLIVASWVFMVRSMGLSNRSQREAAVAVNLLSRSGGSIDELKNDVVRLHNEHGVNIIIRDAAGRVIAAPPDAQPRGRTIVLPVQVGPAAGSQATVFLPPTPLSKNYLYAFPIVLVFVTLGTAAAARWLGGPLNKIAGAARAFGSGDLKARVRLERRDELGEVAGAFDEMADRVEALLRAERELLANVSHELRTPLARIRAALDIANEGDPATAQEMLREITEDLGELQRLVDDVLTAARLDARGEAISLLRREPCGARELLERSVAKFIAQHEETKVVLEAPESLPSIDGDAVLLRRALDNVMENAWKYGPKEGPIAIRARGENDRIAIEIEDHGAGIAEKDLASVFTPFFRADTSRTRATGGLGLGLPLVKRIVEAHHGGIQIESAIGSGTKVKITLPALA
jgi:two-component system, OmpR family, sensor kinase